MVKSNFVKIFFIVILIFFTIDIVIGKFIYKKFIRKNFIDTYQQIYVNTNYDHTLKKELNVIYGNIRYKLCSDKNGFRIGKNLKTKSDEKILFLGDSFAYGFGINYEKSIAGLIRKKTKINLFLI